MRALNRVKLAAVSGALLVAAGMAGAAQAADMARRPGAYGAHPARHVSYHRRHVGCPDRYSCWPLYGAYGPYGGYAYWSAYTSWIGSRRY